MWWLIVVVIVINTSGVLADESLELEDVRSVEWCPHKSLIFNTINLKKKYKKYVSAFSLTRDTSGRVVTTLS